MTAKRIAAIAIAVVLIVAALLIRNGFDDDSSSATDGTDKPSKGKITVICSTEFKVACDRLDAKKYTVSTESAGTTLDRLAKNGAVLPDAWITLDPFPGMIDESRRPNSVASTNPTVTVIATDTPMLAIARSLVGQVETLCGSTVSWKCAGSNAGKGLDGGARLLPGIANPDSEAIGLLTFANAVAGYFGSAALDTATWQDNSGFSNWLRNLQTTAKVNIAAPGAVPLSTLITRKTTVNVAATTASETRLSTRADAFTAFPISPSITYSVVVATFGNRADAVVAAVTPSLITAGWTQATDPHPKLPAGTFIALRRLWEGK
jgi:hypothetical protein